VPPSDSPVLVGCAHGTRDPAGRRAAARLRLDVAALRPGLTVLAASVDVQRPALPQVLARVAAAGRRAVVVPLLLSAGYHVHTDVKAAVAAVPGCVAAAALGPDADLVTLLGERLREAGAPDGAPVVLAAAGSSDVRAVADVERVAEALAGLRGAEVTPAYLSAARPRVEDVVGPGAVVAGYLLSPGFFADRLDRVARGAGAVVVSGPLAPHPLLASLVLRRYDEALSGGG